MNALIASGVVLTILLLSVMLGKKDKLYADQFLIIYLGFSVVRQIYIYIETEGLLNESYWMLFGKGHYLLNAPLFFFYVYALTHQQRLTWKRVGLMLAPFIAYLLVFLYYYGWVFNSSQLSFINGLMYINGELSVPWAFFVFLFLVIEPLFLIWFYISLKSYKRRVADSLSYEDKINLNWLSLIFNIWFISAVVLVPVSMLSVSGVIELPIALMQILLEIACVTFIFILGYYGFKQTTVFSSLELKTPIETQENEVGSYERSGLSQEQARLYHTQLLALMNEKKPYLNGELTANEMAQELGISVNHLSQVLNKNQRQNFFDFVNSYRVTAVKEKMRDSSNHHLTLLAMALDSGFNSKTSFNTVFKKFTNQTPSQFYRPLIRQKNPKIT